MNSSSAKISSQEINAAFREYQQELKNTVHHRFSEIIEKYAHLANDLPPVENSPHSTSIKKSEKRKRELYSLLCSSISISDDDSEPLCLEPECSVLNNLPLIESEKDFNTDSCCLLSMQIKEVDENDCVPVYQIDNLKYLRSLSSKSTVKNISNDKFSSLRKKRKHRRISQFPHQSYAGGIKDHKDKITMKTSCWKNRLRSRVGKKRNLSMDEESQSTQVCKRKKTFNTKCSDQSIKENFDANHTISHDKPSKYFALMEDLSIHIISNLKQVNPRVIFFKPLYVTKENKYSFRNSNDISPRNHMTSNKSESLNRIFKEPFFVVSYPFGQEVKHNRDKKFAPQANDSIFKKSDETSEILDLNISIQKCGKTDELGKHKESVVKNGSAKNKKVMPISRTMSFRSFSKKPRERKENLKGAEDYLKTSSSGPIHQSSPTFKSKSLSHSERVDKEDVLNNQLMDRSHSLKETLEKGKDQNTRADFTNEDFSLINKNHSLKKSLEKAMCRNICNDLTKKNFFHINKSNSLIESLGKDKCQTNTDNLTNENVFLNKRHYFLRKSSRKRNYQTTTDNLINNNVSCICKRHYSLKESSGKENNQTTSDDLTNKKVSHINKSHSLKESLRKENNQTTSDDLTNEKVPHINKSHYSLKESLRKENNQTTSDDLTDEKVSCINKSHYSFNKSAGKENCHVLKSTMNCTGAFKFPMPNLETGNSILSNTQSHVSNISKLTLRKGNPFCETNGRRDTLKNYITLRSKENTSEKSLLFNNPFKKFSSSMEEYVSNEKHDASRKDTSYSIYVNQIKQNALKTNKKNSTLIESNKIISTISKGLNKKLSIISEEGGPKRLENFLAKENSSRNSDTKSKTTLSLNCTYHSLFEDKDVEVSPAVLNSSFSSFQSLMATAKKKSASDDSKQPENLKNKVDSVSTLPSFLFKDNENLSLAKESTITSSFHKLDISQIAGPPNKSLSFRPLKLLGNDTSACPFTSKLKNTTLEKRQKLENVASYLMSQTTEIGNGRNQTWKDVSSVLRHGASESSFASSTFRIPNFSISSMKSSLNKSDIPQTNLSSFLSR